MIGTVTWFRSTLGYGFLRSDLLDKEVFVHFSSIEMDGYKALREGQKVEFEIGPGPKGPQACKVKVIR